MNQPAKHSLLLRIVTIGLAPNLLFYLNLFGLFLFYVARRPESSAYGPDSGAVPAAIGSLLVLQVLILVNVAISLYLTMRIAFRNWQRLWLGFLVGLLVTMASTIIFAATTRFLILWAHAYTTS